MILAAWSAQEWAAVVAPAVVLLVGVITLYVNGERAERWRRRELHARGLAAAIAYAEMPFAIRRRQHEPEHRSAERVRLTTRFSEIQAEIAVCQALIGSEADARIATAYGELVDVTRRVAGAAAREAWEGDAIELDPDVNMPALKSFSRSQPTGNGSPKRYVTRLARLGAGSKTRLIFPTTRREHAPTRWANASEKR